MAYSLEVLLMASFHRCSCAFLLAIALLAFPGSLAAANKAWKIVQPENGGFTCEMPGEAKKATQNVFTAAGPISVVTYLLEAPKGSFMASATAIPRNAPAASTAQRLDGARDGAVKNVKGKLISEKQIRLDKYPGRELVIEPRQGVYIHQRIFMVEDQLIQAVAVSPSKAATEDIARFFQSVKLVKK
jgi:hypothetical protein